MNKYFCLVFSLLMLFVATNAFCQGKESNTFTLSGNEIDLLVGTPEGVSEPLDSRHNKLTKDNQVDYSTFFTENGLDESSSADILWVDAEDSTLNENQVESQLMDLLAETEELEKTDEIFYHEESEENELASETPKISQ